MGRPKRNILAVAEESITPPDSLQPNQSLARVVKAEGSNQYNCELPNGKTVLVELAQRFRNTIWIRRGGYVLLQRYPSEEITGRLEGEIINVVRDEKVWRKQQYWPSQFAKNRYDQLEEDESGAGRLPPSDSEDEG